MQKVLLVTVSMSVVKMRISKNLSLSLCIFVILVKDYKMSFTISGDEAYEIYSNSHLKKSGKKSASFDTIEAILKQKGVKIRPKPSDSVRFFTELCNSTVLHQRSDLRAQSCLFRSSAA